MGTVIAHLQVAWVAFWVGVMVGFSPIVYINIVRLLAAG